ncbi:hypothetical protein QYF61_006261 [Mycteria americana]|uniref:Uncharacterized protein n=1 Tax=Mycteria americana TaxID=33587 RepID=A0AAN7RRQ9_MYCAM|nr:hypothetical protein QYF61_006261 [Mycteria americana]
MLTGPDHLGVLYMPCDSTQDDLLHQLPWHRECPAFLDSFALQDCLPRDSLNQFPEQAEGCPPEGQGGSSADPPPYFSKNQNLYHFMITLPKTASNHHMAHKSFSVPEQEVQQGTFPQFIAIHHCTPVVRVIPPRFRDGNHIIVFLLHNSFQLLQDLYLLEYENADRLIAANYDFGTPVGGGNPKQKQLVRLAMSSYHLDSVYKGFDLTIGPDPKYAKVFRKSILTGFEALNVPGHGKRCEVETVKKSLSKQELSLDNTLYAIFVHVDEIPLSLLFSRLGSPSSLSLYTYCLATTGAETPVQMLPTCTGRPPGWLGAGVQHLSCKERLRGLPLFILKKRSLQRRSYYYVQLPKGGMIEKPKPGSSQRYAEKAEATLTSYNKGNCTWI